jgi:hypothetical protein
MTCNIVIVFTNKILYMKICCQNGDQRSEKRSRLWSVAVVGLSYRMGLEAARTWLWIFFALYSMVNTEQSQKSLRKSGYLRIQIQEGSKRLSRSVLTMTPRFFRHVLLGNPMI